MSLLRIENIEQNRFNPNVMSEEAYSALLEDMRENGIDSFDPILVSKKSDFYGDEFPNIFVIVDGFHRWKAAKELENKAIRANVKKLSESEAKEISYRKNRERGSLDPFKEGELFASESKLGLTHERIAKKYGVNRTYVTRRMQLVVILPEVVEVVKSYKAEIIEKIDELKNMPCESCGHSMLCPRTDFYKNDAGELVCDRQEKGERHTEQMEDLKKELKSLDVPRGTITASHLEEIVTLKTSEARAEAIDKVFRWNDTVSSTKDRVDRLKLEEEAATQLKAQLEKSEHKFCPECGGEGIKENYKDFPWVNCKDFHTWSLDTGLTWDQQQKVDHLNYLEEHPDEKKEEYRLAAERFRPKSFRHTMSKDDIRELLSQRILNMVPTFANIQFIRVEGHTKDGKIVCIDLGSDDGSTMSYSERIYTKNEKAYRRLGDEISGVSFNIEPKEWKTDKLNVVKVNCFTSNEDKKVAIQKFLLGLGGKK